MKLILISFLFLLNISFAQDTLNTSDNWEIVPSYGNQWEVHLGSDTLPVTKGELQSLFELLTEYLTSSEQVVNVYPIYRTPAQSLRDQANEIERRDEVIELYHRIWMRVVKYGVKK